jgi:hypothetical protein
MKLAGGRTQRRRKVTKCTVQAHLENFAILGTETQLLGSGAGGGNFREQQITEVREGRKCHRCDLFNIYLHSRGEIENNGHRFGKRLLVNDVNTCGNGNDEPGTARRAMRGEFAFQPDTFRTRFLLRRELDGRKILSHIGCGRSFGHDSLSVPAATAAATHPSLIDANIIGLQRGLPPAARRAERPER